MRLSFAVYCSAHCVYLSAGSTIKAKLHVCGTDNTDWPPAGDTSAEANLSQKQTVTKFLVQVLSRLCCLTECIFEGIIFCKGGFVSTKLSFFLNQLLS